VSKGSAWDQQSESMMMEHKGDADLFRPFWDCCGVWKEKKIIKEHVCTEKRWRKCSGQL